MQKPATGSPPSIRFADAADLRDIEALHGEQRKWLGHLPYEAFDRYVVNEELLVARADNALLGYLLFDRRNRTNDVKVVHLAVSKARARNGLGRSLIDHLAHIECERERIVLFVRSDWRDQTQFWEAVGFLPVGEKKGRSVAGVPLTAYARELSTPMTLIEAAISDGSSTPVFVDLDVLLDLATDREAGAATRYMFDRLNEHDVHPVCSAQLLRELNKHPIQLERGRARAIALSWPNHLEPAPTELVERISASCPAGEHSDLLHLADAVHHGGKILLSRDAEFTRATAAASAIFDISVQHPSDLYNHLRWAEEPDTWRGDLGDFEVKSAGSLGIESIVSKFLTHDAGETKREFRSRLRDLLVDPDVEARCLTHKGKPVALWASRDRPAVLSVELLRVPLERGSEAVAAAVLTRLRVRALEADSESDATAVGVADRFVSEPARRALDASTELKTENHWTLVAFRGVATPNKVATSLQALGARAPDVAQWTEKTSVMHYLKDLVRSERVFEPLILREPLLPTLLIPVRGGWADRLIGASPNQLSLLGRDAHLATRRDHVYFRADQGIRPEIPSRILWYRSHDDATIYATSLLLEFRTGTPDEIWKTYEKFGVFSRRDVFDAASASGRTMAIRFSQTKVFDSAIPMSRTTLATPQAPMKIEPDDGMAILTEGLCQ